jgi:hypothetical protein
MPSDMRAVDIDFLATAPFRFVFTSQIARPPERVFEAIAEHPESWGDWYPGFDHSGRWLTTDPPAAGSRRAVRMARVTYEETILAWEPSERFAFRVDRAATPIAYALAEDYRISPHPAGSTLEWTFAVDPRAVLKPAMRVARPLMARLFRTTSSRLEKYLTA